MPDRGLEEAGPQEDLQAPRQGEGRGGARVLPAGDSPRRQAEGAPG